MYFVHFNVLNAPIRGIAYAPNVFRQSALKIAIILIDLNDIERELLKKTDRINPVLGM